MLLLLPSSLNCQDNMYTSSVINATDVGIVTRQVSSFSFPIKNINRKINELKIIKNKIKIFLSLPRRISAMAATVIATSTTKRTAATIASWNIIGM